MKKKMPLRLALNRETILRLGESMLGAVEGGTISAGGSTLRPICPCFPRPNTNPERLGGTGSKQL